MEPSDASSIACPRCGVRLRKPSPAELAQARCPACDAPLAPQSQETVTWGGQSPTIPGSSPFPSPSSMVPPHHAPQGVPGISLELDERHSRGYQPRKSRFAGVGMVVSAITLMLLSSAVVVALYLRLNHPELFQPPVKQDTVGLRIIPGDYSVPTKWIDAATSSARVGGLRIKIDRIEIGPVIAKGGDLEIVESETDVLQIYLTLRNESEEEIDYVSWYGNEFEVGGKIVYAKLSRGGQQLPMLVFEDAAGIYGHVPRALIRPKETVLDSLIFELGEGADSRTGPWRLELPQAAFEFQGSLGFEIDDRSLRQASPLESPADATKSETDATPSG